MTAKLCGLIGSAFLGFRSRIMLMAAVCGLPFCCGAIAVIHLPLSVFLGSFLSTNSTCDGDRNIRKTRLPSRPVISRTATVDYERGARFVFLVASHSSVAVQIRFRCVFYVCRLCQTGIILTRFRAADFRLNRVIRFANTVKY